MSKIHLLTLSWNGKDKLEKLYDTLIPNMKGLDWQWLIKDNGSADDSYLLNDKWKNDNVNIIKCAHNKDNFAQGCNLLFNEANCKDEDIVVLLNNDITFGDTSSLSKMIDILHKDSEVGAVGAKLKYTSTDVIQHGGVVIASNGFPIHFRANQKDDKNASRNRQFQACTGACLAIKAKYYSMDEKFQWCFEDIDTCLDIVYNQNKKIVYCGNVNIFHEESASLKKNPVNKLYLSHNLAHFNYKWNKKINVDYGIYSKDAAHRLYEK